MKWPRGHNIMRTGWERSKPLTTNNNSGKRRTNQRHIHLGRRVSGLAELQGGQKKNFGVPKDSPNSFILRAKTQT